VKALALALLLLPLAGLAAPRVVTLAYQGDVGGEVAPCG
jgi:hypothetical protein